MSKMKTTKKYWKGLAQLNDDPIVEKLAQNEFVEDLPVDQFLGDKKIFLQLIVVEEIF